MTHESPEALLSRPDLRRLVREGKIDIATARRSSEIPAEILKEFKAVLTGLSFSSTRIFLTQLRELLAGKTKEDARTLTERLLAAPLPAEELELLRMPELSEMQKSFREITGRLLKGTGLDLKAPPFFEGSRFTVTFSFAGPEELARKIRALEKLKNEGASLYELL